LQKTTWLQLTSIEPIAWYGSMNQLEFYQQLLLKWNQKINLIGQGTESDFRRRHIDDSLQVCEYIPKTAKTLADFGSGAGLPGLIIAIAKPEIQAHLIESDSRKCAFLQEAKAQLQLPNIVIHNDRVEKIRDLKPDIITARAFSDLKTFLEIALLFQNNNNPNLLNILLKGGNVDSEIETAKKFYDFKYEIHKSATDESGKILLITSIGNRK